MQDRKMGQCGLEPSVVATPAQLALAALFPRA